MTGNVALDVVIGLVFIYLLYSLYATILMEILSSFFGLRARNLSYAIKRMLMDERRYDRHRIEFVSRGKPLIIEFKVWWLERPLHWLSELIGTFTQPAGIAINLKNRRLSEKFFAHPSIRSLRSGSLNNMPSYIPAETFSKVLIDTIKVDDPDLNVITSVLVGLEDDILLPADSETRKLIKSFLKDANNDLVKFQLLLERWYNDTMDRSVGWFKRTTQIALAAIGLTLAISFNVDSIAIIKKLSIDKEAREQMVSLASQFNEGNSSAIELAKSSKDTSIIVADLNKRLSTLDTMRRSLEKDINSTRNILSSDWHLLNSIQPEIARRRSVHEDSMQLAYAANVKDAATGDSAFFIVHKSIDPKLFRRSLPEVFSNKDRIEVNTAYYKFWNAADFDNIWGYLLTVLAISLGAPFWFDLLNKLVKVRTSQRPDTSSGQGYVAGVSKVSPEAAKATLNRAG
jgi:hypothetical protein